jgi:polyribonucleotide nucleotidyltransferase
MMGKLLTLNPWVLIGLAALLAAITGTFYYQQREIHHWHVAYDAANVVIGQRDQTIHNMTEAQNSQIAKTDQNVIKVVQVPQRVQPIINMIQKAPSNGICKAPKYPKEVTDAF